MDSNLNRDQPGFDLDWNPDDNTWTHQTSPRQ